MRVRDSAWLVLKESPRDRAQVGSAFLSVQPGFNRAEGVGVQGELLSFLQAVAMTNLAWPVPDYDPSLPRVDGQDRWINPFELAAPRGFTNFWQFLSDAEAIGESVTFSSWPGTAVPERSLALVACDRTGDSDRGVLYMARGSPAKGWSDVQETFAEVQMEPSLVNMILRADLVDWLTKEALGGGGGDAMVVALGKRGVVFKLQSNWGFALWRDRVLHEVSSESLDALGISEGELLAIVASGKYRLIHQHVLQSPLLWLLSD